MLIILLSILIGLVTGVIQFYLLYKFVTSVTGGKSGLRTLIFAITQFLFPFAVLVLCAFLLTDNLMWVGIGAGTSLIACAVIKFVFMSKHEKKNTDKKKK
ncbi:MAG: hypothetical protein FWD38_09970 [Oscillospiraceae bacterium]|nr:hypothetical protein [Oscillospiraceae bacterium]